MDPGRRDVPGEPDPIVVGYDGSAAARAALRWAADAAARYRAPLRLVYATQRTWRPASRAWSGDTIAEPWEGDLSPRAVVARGVDGAAARVAYGIPVSSLVVTGPAAVVLCDQSIRARMLVLGTGGSTSRSVAGHAACPVVTLRDHDPVNEPTGPVVVTIDHPADARPALGFAFAEAAASGASLTAVGIRTAPAEAMAAWERQYPYVPVTVDLIANDTGPALLRLSRAARLLVIAPHRRVDGVDRVSRYLLRHATCPLVIARARTVAPAASTRERVAA
jgi:nucleotide-binding universal stress UspA family protein